MGISFKSKHWVTWSLIASAPMFLSLEACGKKKKSDSVATTDTAAALSRLNITSIDLLGLSAASESASMRLDDTTGDFDKDKSRLYVQDDALDALGQADSILCFFSQVNYTDMADKGPYLAQADMDKCFKDGGGSSSESSASSKELVNLTVESKLTDAGGIDVNAWFEMTAGDGDQIVSMRIKMLVEEGPSDANPIGKFTLSWRGEPKSMPGKVMMKGLIKAESNDDGSVSLKLADISEGQRADLQIAAAKIYPNAEGGVEKGFVKTSSNRDSQDGKIKNFAAAFNETDFLRSAPDGNKCMSKDKYDYTVWRYGLYDVSDRNRVEHDGGMPIEWADGESKVYGYASYWGLYYPENKTLPSTVSSRNSDGSSTNYTVTQYEGRLFKRTKNTAPLSSLSGIDLDAWTPSGNVIVRYNGTIFQKVGTRSQGQGGNGEVVTWLATPESFTLQSAWNANKPAANRFFSRALGGDVTVNSDNTGAISGNSFSYYTEVNVTTNPPTEVLNCYQNCLKPGATSSSDSTYQTANGQAPTLRTYKWSGKGLIETSNADAKVLPAANYQGWGMRSGPMLPASVTIDNPSASWGQDTYYVYETGLKNNNKHISLKDAAGKEKTFSAPLQVSYTHSAVNDLSSTTDSQRYYGKKLSMNYDGFGNLQGIPGIPTQRGYEALFAIKDGSLAGANNEYLVKGLDVVARLRSNTGGCSGLALDGTLELPTKDLYVDPGSAISDIPTTDGIVKVTEGELVP